MKGHGTKQIKVNQLEVGHIIKANDKGDQRSWGVKYIEETEKGYYVETWPYAPFYKAQETEYFNFKHNETIRIDTYAGSGEVCKWNSNGNEDVLMNYENS